MSDNNQVTKKSAKKQNGFVRFFVRIGSWFKRVFSGMFAELKKVTWPTFSKVVKQTGVVLGVVLLFLIVVAAFDVGLEKVLTLVSNAGK